jgi:hypothetical protein
MTVESLVVEIRNDFNAEVRLRVSRSLEALVGAIKEAYARPTGTTPEGVPMGFTASHGASGAIGAINWTLTEANNFIEATIGVSDSARYLRNLEFGERGTVGGPPGGALLSRSLAPPVRNVYEWLRMASIETPQYFKDRAERFRAMAASKHKHPSFDKNKDKPWYSSDAQMQFAFYIAMKRKKYGRAAMHVIQRTAEQYTDKIRNYLQGAG